LIEISELKYMGRRSECLKLPPNVREQLDIKIRLAAYSDYVNLSLWLSEQGYKVSKSAVHRHGLALQQSDAASGLPTAKLSIQAPSITNRTKNDLLQELGELRIREIEITHLLREIEARENSRDK